MRPLPDIEDLLLVLAVARATSISAAARELQVSQPSASQRLARLERQLGVPLFERDTRGTRPTPAGLELIARARTIVTRLEEVYDASRAAAQADQLVIGTFVSFADTLFPILDRWLSDVAIEPVVQHRDHLVEAVADGSMDTAFVAIPDRYALPPGAASRVIGYDELVLFLPAGVAAPGSGRQPFKDRRMLFTTYDLGGQVLRQRLIRLGADVRRGATTTTTLAIARERLQLAVLPRSALAGRLQPGERILQPPFRTRFTLGVITGPRPPAALADVFDRLPGELGLLPPRQLRTPFRPTEANRRRRAPAG